MFEEVAGFLNVILILLYIFFVIILITVIIQVYYPNFSIWNYLNKEKHIKKDNVDSESDSEELEDIYPNEDKQSMSPESVNSSNDTKHLEYTRFNQNFKVINVNSIQDTHKVNMLKSNKVTYEDLKRLLNDDDFLEGYLDSVRLSLTTKLKTYTKEKNEAIKEINSHSSGNANAINATKDTHLEILVIKEKVLTDIIDVIKKKIPKLSIDKLRKNFKSMIYNKEKGFVSLVGREDIKNFIAGQIYTFYKNPLIMLDDSQGIRLLGNSGVGKTRVAQTMAFIYSKSFMLEYEDIVEKSPKDVTSHYVNEDKKNTYKILLSCLGKVLFIDEAYGIVGTGISFDRNYGEGVITELVAFDAGHTGRYIPILAGYEKEMEIMMSSNQGLERRFPHKFVLKDYTSQQLTDILIGSIKKKDASLQMDEKDENCIFTFVDTLYEKDRVIFEKQGSDMIKLASHILTSIYASTKYYWESGKENFTKRAYLLTCGFNSYLESKGLVITF